MKVYLARKFNSFKRPIWIIYFQMRCGDLKHLDFDLLESNEDINNYFETYYGKFIDIVQVATSLKSSPYKKLGKSIRLSGVFNIRSERTAGQYFEDYSNSTVGIINVSEEVLIKGFIVKDMTPERIRFFTKKNQFKLLKYIRYKWIEKNGLEITDPED